MASDVDPRFDPAFQRGYEPPPEVEPVETRVVIRPDASVEPAPVVELVETRPRNPWLVSLWVTAVLFIVGGIGAQYFSQSMLQTGNIYDSAIDYYVVSSTVSALAPWFVGAGLFAGVSALVLSAVRWRPEGG